MSTRPATSPFTRPALAEWATGALLLLLIAASMLAFVLPWRPPRADVSPELMRYAPVGDGYTTLTLARGEDGQPRTWTSSTQRVVPPTRALATDLRQAQYDAVMSFYGSGDEPADLTHVIELLGAGAQLIEQRTRELDTAGVISDTIWLNVRDRGNEWILGFSDPQRDQDVFFEPALQAYPQHFAPGESWQQSGMFSEQVAYNYEGRVLERGEYRGEAGQFADCAKFETRLRLTLGGTTLDDIRTTSWNCANIGQVENSTVNDVTGISTRSMLVAAPGFATRQADLPPITPLAAPPDLTPNMSEWAVSRVGMTREVFGASSTSVAPVWVPANPPLLLAASIEGDLVAFDAADPQSPIRWRFDVGGTIHSPPGYDPATGRIFVGASDKRLYALDTNGMFLWSFATGDNIATRPLVAGDVVVFGSEDRNIYGVNKHTGALAWKEPLGTDGPVVSSPILVDGVVVIGGDDGLVRAIDPTSGEPRWEAPFAAGGAIEAPLYATDGRIYAASYDGIIYGLDPVTGEEVWRSQEGSPYHTAAASGMGRVFAVNQFGELNAFDGTNGRRMWLRDDHAYVGPPIIIGDALIVGDTSGRIHQFDSMGQLRESWDTRPLRAPRSDAPALDFAPVLGGDALWIGDDNGEVFRLGAARPGARPLALSWHQTTEEPPFRGLSGASMRYTPAVYGNQIVALDSTGAIYLVDPETGRAKLRAQYSGEPLPISFLPDVAVSGDMLLIGARGTLTGINLANGAQQWQISAAGETEQYRPVVIEGTTVLWLTGRSDDNQGATGTLHAVDLSSGATRWEQKLEGFSFLGGLVARDGVVYSATPPAAFEIGSGKPRWRADVAGSLGGPALSPNGDVFYVAALTEDGQNGAVVALDVANGVERWRAAMDTVLLAGEQLLATDSHVVVPTIDGRLIALHAADGRVAWETHAQPIWGATSLIDEHVWQVHSDGRVIVRNAEHGDVSAFYNALEVSLGRTGLSASRPVRVGERVILALNDILVAFEVPR